MRTTIPIHALIGCLLLALSLWAPRNGTDACTPPGEPVAASTADMAADVPHGDDAIEAEWPGSLPRPMTLILFAAPGVRTRLAVPAIFRPPIA